VSESAPHGVVCFVRPAEASFDQRAVEKLDGLPVRYGRQYRVIPGNHEVVVRGTEIRVNSYKPMTTRLFGNSTGASGRPATVNVPVSGQASVSGVQPFAGQQMVNLNVESRERFEVTNVLRVEVGWLYEFDGYTTTKTRLPK